MAVGVCFGDKMDSSEARQKIAEQYPALKEIEDKLDEAKKYKEKYEICLQEARNKFALLNNQDIHNEPLLDFLAIYYLTEPLIPTKLIQEAIGDDSIKCTDLAKRVKYHCPNCNEYISFRNRQLTQQYINGNISEDHYCQKCKDEIRQKELAKTRTWKKEHEEREQLAELRLQELRSMPYAEYLQTPEWKETRLRKMKRAKFRCQICGGQGILNVHHISYANRGCENDADLIVLCVECHSIYHSKGKISEEESIYMAEAAL